MNENVAAELRTILESILAHIVDDATIVCEAGEGVMRADIRTGKPEVVIGREGQVLEAIQLLSRRMLSRKFSGEELPSIIVDTAGHMAEREEELIRMAEDLADRVNVTGRSVLLPPMNAWERKVIHTVIRDMENVETESEDGDDGRQVRIRRKLAAEGGAREDSTC
ncbi:MAG: hypothetical protein PHN82_02710 [bacterium]|nr:hypothetical protein [bacterium]